MSSDSNGVGLLAIVVVLAAMSLLGICGWYVWKHQTARAAVAHGGVSSAYQIVTAESGATQGSLATTREFMEDLKSDAPADAYALTSAYFRGSRTGTEGNINAAFGRLQRYVGGQDFTQVGFDGGEFKGKHVAGVEYRFDGSSTIYVLLTAENNATGWKIANFEYSSSRLNPLSAVLEFNE